MKIQFSLIVFLLYNFNYNQNSFVLSLTCFKLDGIYGCDDEQLNKEPEECVGVMKACTIFDYDERWGRPIVRAGETVGCIRIANSNETSIGAEQKFMKRKFNQRKLWCPMAESGFNVSFCCCQPIPADEIGCKNHT